ncbi:MULTISPECIES: DUF768 domain-containing protein [unclassified Mesorhizobium]|uniref:DUF768 domain-containing protein n=1 Tax=unclassified Mesorhizobium TaxID=325217 RepID=UPI000FDAA319|nr:MULTISPECIES: DUF768 domain-containing protein [unclassified Mesorhizobium]TGQ32508.1 DUF768 domain-containing protein [Mesorhizobium sp. M00.F.Ca.ET.216.01.1.1]TIS53550.1 MAG: DUF768 domain-containing protein [Mesorhizobium sp.]TIS86177.1 MAG: DUF768 domain-containing protein [Mesorhizobium sp.]TJW03674.1 MAG: DUF768 domain-containing protein [Mesorhizobium sp.]TJW41738.1 MAG: DUF768 domain-containing protein [Mesorhizobium sp.]
MSTRGADFLYRWISTHMPEGAIDDPVLVVTDLAEGAMKAADAEGIANGEIDEEIGSVYEAIIHALRHRQGGLAD